MSPIACVPPERAQAATIDGFSWPTTAYSSLSSAMRAASALSRPPWPTIIVRTRSSLEPGLANLAA